MESCGEQGDDARRRRCRRRKEGELCAQKKTSERVRETERERERFNTIQTN